MRLVAVLLATMLVAGCGSAATPSPGTDAATTPSIAMPSIATTGSPSAITAAPSASSSPISRDDGWRADVDGLLAARERLHPDPWHGMDRATWVAAADAVRTRIPTMTDDQVLVELLRLAVLPGRGGREGHTGMFPFIPGSGTHVYPLRFWQFTDGLVITAARAPYEDLVGTRLESIDGRPIGDVLALVEPLTPRDNPSNLLAYEPIYLRTSELLAGLGVLEQAGAATFSVVDPSGARRDVEVEPITAEDDIAWHGQTVLGLPAGDALWLSNMSAALWWSYLGASRTLYVQYDPVERGIDATADDILARAKDADVDRVVVDLRNNGGGDNTTYGHFLGVLQDPAIDRPGRLTILVGRLTFSAAANFATDLERTTDARFAGEAMGGSPNLYGDAHRVDLPYGHQAVFIATRYWQKSTPDDPRVTIEPNLPVPFSSADYLAGRDPVLDAVIGEAASRG